MGDDQPAAGNDGVSRRSFLRTLGLSAAAAPLARSADAAPRGRTDDAPILGPGPIDVTLRVNGRPHTVPLDPATTLLETLRVHLDFTGTKEICDRGACGGCSVLVDGVLTASCMML
ncbi:MAG: 2Fe-2S iron-sulfur cluster-binding protein, partial [Planctomycetota bacterium]